MTQAMSSMTALNAKYCSYSRERPVMCYAVNVLSSQHNSYMKRFHYTTYGLNQFSLYFAGKKLGGRNSTNAIDPKNWVEPD